MAGVRRVVRDGVPNGMGAEWVWVRVSEEVCVASQSGPGGLQADIRMLNIGTSMTGRRDGTGRCTSSGGWGCRCREGHTS